MSSNTYHTFSLTHMKLKPKEAAVVIWSESVLVQMGMRFCIAESTSPGGLSNVIIKQILYPISFCVPTSPESSPVLVAEEVGEKKPCCDFKDCQMLITGYSI